MTDFHSVINANEKKISTYIDMQIWLRIIQMIRKENDLVSPFQEKSYN